MVLVILNGKNSRFCRQESAAPLPDLNKFPAQEQPSTHGLAECQLCLSSRRSRAHLNSRMERLQARLYTALHLSRVAKPPL